MYVSELSGQSVRAFFPHLASVPGLIGVALEGLDAAIAASLDPFDSEFLGHRVAWIRDARAPSQAAMIDLLNNLGEKLRAAGFDHVLRRVEAADLPQIWALQGVGFDLMDVSVTLARRFEKPHVAGIHERIVVRQASPTDLDEVVRLLAGDPWGGRYENDPEYSFENVTALRTRWLQNSHRGRADLFLVGVVDGQVAGYATGILDSAARSGKVELVGTVPAFRHRGVASAILDHLFAWFSTRVDLLTVRTQAANYRAVHLYEKAGFFLACSELIYRLSLGTGQECYT